MADALFAIKKLVFEQKRFTLVELKEALENNFGKGAATTDSELEKLVVGIVQGLTESGMTVSEEQIEKIYENLKADSNISMGGG